MEVLHRFAREAVQNLYKFGGTVRSARVDRYDVGAMTDDSKRDLWHAAEQARAAGWDLEMSAGGHLVLRSPHGGNLVLTGVASAHRRTAGNVEALVRRYGSAQA